MTVKKEAQPRGKTVNIHAALEARLNVFHAVAQRKRQFLNRRAARLADVIPRNRHAVPLRHELALKLDGVNHQLHAWLGRVNKLVLGMKLFKNVVLQRATQRVPVNAALLGHRQVHGPDYRRGAVNRLAHRHAADGNIRVQPVHVLDRAYCYAALAHFTGRERIITIAAHQRGQVKRRAQASVRGR